MGAYPGAARDPGLVLRTALVSGTMPGSPALRAQRRFVARHRELAVLLQRRNLADDVAQHLVGRSQTPFLRFEQEHALIDQGVEHGELRFGRVEHFRLEVGAELLAQLDASPVFCLVGVRFWFPREYPCAWLLAG